MERSKSDSSRLSLTNADTTKEIEENFSSMITQTVENGVNGSSNIFEHTFVPRDWYGGFLRSVVPQKETIRTHLLTSSSSAYFNYDETNQDGRYSFKVLDRKTNQLIFEQMPSYHKLGMKLLFSGSVQRELLQKRSIKKFFEHETKRLGKAFDEPKSRKHIQAFVKMYRLDVDELLEPDLTKYSCFNEFFYRKLKPNVRPIDSVNDPTIVVSSADCRLIVFNTIDDATRIWIKGQRFSLKHLFNNEEMAETFKGGSLAVFRLAPVDYHRFHSPVTGIWGKEEKLSGTYYTVNPVAIKENIDVLTKNQRVVATIETDNELFGSVGFVAVGALLVGSINFTVEKEQLIRKGDEVGYFAYGGSTIVVVFKDSVIKWDDDLLHNSNNSMETLVRIGERIGIKTTNEEKQLLQQKQQPQKDVSPHTTIKRLFEMFPTVAQ
ncbi:unnamed protein product [Didymodactylos carnosus]|uniref:phosphatidylserine decarboxylase n=1 Tax=Didymodactylos carnosus TaxID=1234261 RepID=A0A813QFS3_9BILA|nr:unnamed protein product [Didymodactylos carnosus]CAF0859037.1 unnamed protein product [Didymodactylos carnosus]CAF3547905.1 unnamed protein product [Didymodactylos carnosus]CAF3644026.1 unnamed protein product [Didymodactylos carnosus]